MPKKRPANDPKMIDKPSAAGDQAHKKWLDGYPGAAAPRRHGRVAFRKGLNGRVRGASRG